MPAIDEAFARVVRRELAQRGRTIPWLAGVSTIPERTLRSVLTGEQATVKLHHVCLIAQALDMHCSDLVAEADALVEH